MKKTNLIVKNKNRVGQISIFIILAFSIVFLMGFLIFSTGEDKAEKVEESKESVEPTIKDLRPIKDRVDYCIEWELKRAAIIAGVRGGIIFDKGERYIQSNIPSDTYTPNMIGNSFELNWNFLESKTLLHTDSMLGFPKFNDVYLEDFNDTDGFVDINYSHSIKEDFEKYIAIGFMKCLNIEEYEKKGYEVEYEKYATTGIEVFSSDSIIVKNLTGKIGDDVEIFVEGVEIIGTIIANYSDEIMKIEISQSAMSSLITNQDFENIDVLNLNASIDIEVDFKSEKIGAKIYFPATIRKGDLEIGINTAYSEVNIRFKTLYDVANRILGTKIQDKRIDLSNNTQLTNILNSNSYLRRNGLEGLKFIKAILYESEEEKIFLYSLIDENSKILGKDFVFSFGYRNEAPIIDLENLESDGFIGESVLFIVGENVQYEFELESVTTEKQIVDLNGNYFEPDSYNGLDADYKLTADGHITFTAYERNRYSYDIVVTDGEAIRRRNVVFLVGFPDNTNNREASNCLSFKNNPSGDAFPIATTFKNQLTDKVNVGGFHEVYGHQLYLPEATLSMEGISEPAPSEIKVKHGCVMDYGGMFSVKVTEINQNVALNYDEDTKTIEVPIKDYTQTIEIDLIDSTGASVIEPYTVTIYPASCLGPEPISGTDMTAIGGDFSCCDTSQLIDTEGVPIQDDLQFLGLESSGNPIDADIYLCMNFDVRNYFGEDVVFDYTNYNLWNEFGLDTTSLYSGILKATCKGKIPNALANLDGVLGGSSSNMIDMIKLGNEVYSVNHLPFNVDTEITNTEECKFCSIENTIGIEILTDDGKPFEMGLISANPHTDLIVIPDDSEYLNTLVKCGNDNDIFGWNGTDFENAYLDFNKNIYNPELKLVKTYCEQGSTSCVPRENSENLMIGYDDRETCVDYWYSGDILNPIIGPMPATWTSYTDTSYQNPVCNPTTNKYDCTEIINNVNCDGVTMLPPSSTVLDDPLCNSDCP